jgi:hypothetical protein
MIRSALYFLLVRVWHLTRFAAWLAVRVFLFYGALVLGAALAAGEAGTAVAAYATPLAWAAAFAVAQHLIDWVFVTVLRGLVRRRPPIARTPRIGRPDQIAGPAVRHQSV